jgi:hypothetical protein
MYFSVHKIPTFQTIGEKYILDNGTGSCYLNSGIGDRRNAFGYRILPLIFPFYTPEKGFLITSPLSFMTMMHLMRKGKIIEAV